MSVVHHRKLPNHWAVVSGRAPPDEFGFKSSNIQIIYNNTTEPWIDEHAHLHKQSDEIYIVLEGEMKIKVGEEMFCVLAGELLCVGANTPHQLVGVSTPHKSFVVRGPAIEDKFHVQDAAA